LPFILSFLISLQSNHTLLIFSFPFQFFSRPPSSCIKHDSPLRARALAYVVPVSVPFHLYFSFKLCYLRGYYIGARRNVKDGQACSSSCSTEPSHLTSFDSSHRLASRLLPLPSTSDARQLRTCLHSLLFSYVRHSIDMHSPLTSDIVLTGPGAQKG